MGSVSAFKNGHKLATGGNMNSMISMALVVLGLTAFEVINSVDNAVINADILAKMSAWDRRWFLLWGLLIAVFAVRGLLPWLIVWQGTGLTAWQAVMATFSSDPQVVEAMHRAAPTLLLGAGMFLFLLFTHWFFMEEKNIAFHFERHAMRHGVWFYTIASLVLLGVVWHAIHLNPMIALGAVAGSSAFFIMLGFKHSAEEAEKKMVEGSSHLSDWSMILLLEVIDTCFSVDGVLGAFAFTMSVPLILIGNGIGALVVRQLTVGNIERVRSLKLLKNGAMYSVLFLSIILHLEGFGVHVPEWLSPVVTFMVVGYFFGRSWTALKRLEA
jgi:hypothetical protein